MLFIFGLYILKFFGNFIFGFVINFKLLVFEIINFIVIVLFVFIFLELMEEVILNFFIFLEKLVGLFVGNGFILIVILGVIIILFIFI